MAEKLLSHPWKNGGDNSKAPTVYIGEDKTTATIIADGDTDVDGSPRAPQIDPTGQLETSLRKSNGWKGEGDNCNAEKIPYFVLPTNWNQITGMVCKLGDMAKLTYKDKTIYAIYADAGPKKLIGEASLCVIEYLGVNPWNSSKTKIITGIAHGVKYEIKSGTAKLDKTVDFESIQFYGKELFDKTSAEVILKLGSKGQAVKDLQTILDSNFLAGLECDGDFGAKTEAAVKAAEIMMGFEPVGIVSASLLNLMRTFKLTDPNLTLITEARKWIGVREPGGSNKGPIVEMFQKAVDNKASGESWCMSFCQYCIQRVEAALTIKSSIFRTEHCLTCWQKSPKEIRLTDPVPGCVVIWQHGKTSNGHTGIVTAVTATTIQTIEGNTNQAGSREGDGVYAKNRQKSGDGDMHILGYLKAF